MLIWLEISIYSQILKNPFEIKMSCKLDKILKVKLIPLTILENLLKYKSQNLCSKFSFEIVFRIITFKSSMVIWLNKVYHVIASRRRRLYTTKSDFEFSMGLHSIFIKFNGFKTVFVFFFFLLQSFSFQRKSDNVTL